MADQTFATLYQLILGLGKGELPVGTTGAASKQSIAANGLAIVYDSTQATGLNSADLATVAALSGYAPLAGATFTGPIIDSVVGAASTPSVLLSGAPYTGGTGTTTHPHLYVNSGAAPSTWSTSGTLIGCNASSGFGGNIFAAHVNGGAAVISISSVGGVVCGAITGTSITAGAGSTLGFNGRSKLVSSADGKITLRNSGATDFTSLHFGLLDATRPSLKVTGTSLGFRLSDDSADSPMSASAGTFSGALSATELTLTTTPLAPASGGTGVASPTDHAVLLGSGTDPVTPLAVGTTDKVLTGVTGADPVWKGQLETFPIAASDLTTPVTTGTGKSATLRLPYAFTVTGVSLSATASTAGTITVDVNEAAVTILSTKASLGAGVLYSENAVISDPAIAANAAITIDFDAVGGTSLTGIVVTLTGFRT